MGENEFLSVAPLCVAFSCLSNLLPPLKHKSIGNNRFSFTDLHPPMFKIKEFHFYLISFTNYFNFHWLLQHITTRIYYNIRLCTTTYIAALIQLNPTQLLYIIHHT